MRAEKFDVINESLKVGKLGMGGRARTPVWQALEAGALKSEQGRRWTEGGKSNIDAEDSKRTH